MNRWVCSLAAVTLTSFGLSSLPVQGASVAALCENLRQGPSAKVVGVPDGDTLLLSSGLKVRLVGIQAPKLPLGRPEFEAWPLAQEAQHHLETLALGHMVQLHYGGTERDRHGRALAQALVVDAGADPLWLQDQMIGAGFARAYSFADNRSCANQLLLRESAARNAKRGLWENAEYAIKHAEHPDSLAKREGHFELVEGRILDTGQSGQWLYLNFGRYWKEDFTIVMDKRAQRLFTAYDPSELSGAVVRIRGWIERDGGPRITLTHPEQLELLARQ